MWLEPRDAVRASGASETEGGCHRHCYDDCAESRESQLSLVDPPLLRLPGKS